MKTFSRLIFLLLSFVTFQPFCQQAYALGYIISFSGSGAATSVQSVEVQNLTRGTTVTVPAGSALKLYDGTTTAVTNPVFEHDNLELYPNPVVNQTRATFSVKQAGPVSIRLISSAGKILSEKSYRLTAGQMEINLTVPVGVYCLQVSGIGYRYSAKVVGTSPQIKPSISINKTDVVKSAVKQQPETTPLVSMFFVQGDRLLYKGQSGNYCTLVVDVPTVSKTVDFNFVECKDVDNNYYSVVQIGSQLWMAENLRTTKYRNGDVIGTTATPDANIYSEQSPKYQWPCNGDESYVAAYGRLYSWYAVKDSRGLAPGGWHVATDAEWRTLQNYLIVNGYNYDKSTTDNKTAISLTTNSGWMTSQTIGSPGFDMSMNNSSGFSMYPTAGRFNNGFYSFGFFCGVWTQTESDSSYALYVQINNNGICLFMQLPSNKNYGFAVRCVVD